MIYWSPTERELRNSAMALFRDAAEQHSGASLPDYESFHRWSVEHATEFWSLWLGQGGFVFEGSPERVFVPNPSGEFFGGRWFPDLKLNYAENLMARLAETPLVGIDELGRKKVFSASTVQHQVRGLQLYLRSLGVGPGDVVAGVLPNIPETVVAMLAVTSLGAAWSSCSPDFGVTGILDRFKQVSPKVLFVADGYAYNGKRIDLGEKNAAVRAALPSLESVITIPFLSEDGGDYQTRAESDGREPEFTRVPFNAPLYIMFSSGTTGQPKCIVHGVGGTLLQLKKELVLHSDLKPGERILYYSTCGWMMWNWVVCALAAGATVYCYDGSPGAPKADSLWDWVNREEIDVFGTSAKFLATNRIAGLKLREKFAFKRLRLVLSTGSPLTPEDFDYFYESVSPVRAIPLASISGGTDILSCFMLGSPMKPVVRGEIQARGLGLDVQAFDDAGHSLIDQKGELVCARPFPSMPVGFANDPGDRKFRRAYFERFPGVWHHGDYITICPGGGVIIHGRSDATLNPGGVRIGTAEIYRQVETHPLVQDSLVVGQRWQGDERVILFVKLKDPTASLDARTAQEIKDRIRAHTSPRHVPAKIIRVSDIPYTVSGKKVELAVKAILHGDTPNNVEALANPASLELYKNLSELRV